MSEKRIFRALFKTMILFAVVHLTVSFVLFVLSFNFSYLSVFTIVSMSELFPGIEKGLISFVISTLIAVGVYIMFYKQGKRS